MQANADRDPEREPHYRRKPQLHLIGLTFPPTKRALTCIFHSRDPQNLQSNPPFGEKSSNLEVSSTIANLNETLANQHQKWRQRNRSERASPAASTRAMYVSLVSPRGGSLRTAPGERQKISQTMDADRNIIIENNSSSCEAGEFKTFSHLACLSADCG